MTEILGIVKDLLIGSGNIHDFGIRLLIITIGILGAILGRYIRKDIQHYGDALDKYGKSLHSIDENARQMDRAFEAFKKELSNLLNLNLEEMRGEFYDLRVHILDLSKKLDITILRLDSFQERMKMDTDTISSSMHYLDDKLKQTNESLAASHETREDLYGLMRLLRTSEENQKKTFGRVIILEDFTKRYADVLAALEKVLAKQKK